MKIAILRVGIDSGSGGMQGPLLRDGSFEYIPIPDVEGKDGRTYGNTTGRLGRRLVEYFPSTRQERYADQAIHFDPEFETFTYGDPSQLKAGLRRLQRGDLLVFYCGLQGWDFESPPALYLLGYFEVQTAGRASRYSLRELEELFSQNFHVRHRAIFERQKKDLVLVRGTPQSRMLAEAVCISEMGRNRAGRPIKVLSREMQRVFGDFDGRISIQRSPPRWVKPSFVPGAAAFIRSLEND